MPSQRRIDHILADDYLDGIEELATGTLREMRDDCEREETGISYTRRVLQGRIDILRAEIESRSEAGSEKAASVLRSLPTILGDDERDPSQLDARPPRHLQPPVMHRGRRDVDRVADESSLGSLSERETEELADMTRELIERERALSETRRALLDRIDALQEELARRYKEGGADVADVLSGTDDT